MYPHHQATIDSTIEHFKAQPGVRALLLGGSIAHGFAKENSDVDIMIIVSDEDHQQRVADQHTGFFSRELSTYEEGYVDGKYISEGFLAQVAQLGSEPARFAFADTQILFSEIDGLEAKIQAIVRYPIEEKITRIKRFYAQHEAWHWFVSEATKKQNPYLLATAISKLTLFGGRLILAHNEALYPFHKWYLSVLDRVQTKPANMVEMIRELNQSPSLEGAEAFYNMVKGFREWEHDEHSWGNRFMFDTELTWLYNSPAIDDI
jgi:predicted nucleotidyltransferase